MKNTVKKRLLSRCTTAISAVLSALALASSSDKAGAQLVLTPGVDYSKPNYAFSPPLRKFVDKLPGLASANTNSLGQYVPIAIASTPYGSPYAGCDYYEIGLVEYFERMHQDLPAGGTKLRGYVQIVPSTFPGAVPLDKAHGLSMNVTNKAGQTVYGVDKPHYAGPMIVAYKGQPVRVKFSNLLPTGAAGRSFIPLDTAIPGAGNGPVKIGTVTNNVQLYEQYTQNRADLNLDGGLNPWASDGNSHQWITPAGEKTSYHKGVDALNAPDMADPGDGSVTYYWPNLQSGRLLWYHDHSYGMTGPNVYAGELAPYLLVDPAEETALANLGVPGVLAAGPSLTNDFDHHIQLVLQDKTFVPDSATLAKQDPNWLTDAVDGMTGLAPTTGSLWFPHVYIPNQWPNNPDLSGMNPFGRWDYGPWQWPPWNVRDPYPPRVSHVPEAFHDTPVVNGQPYPYLDVQPAAYRLQLINAASDRFFNLQLYTSSSIISNIVMAVAGSGYDSTLPPNVTITGGGGQGALASAIVAADGSISGIKLIVSGSGFTNAPIVTIDPPSIAGGVQAAATAQIYSGNSEVGMVVANIHSGISFPPVWRTSTPGYTPDVLDNRPGGVPDPATRGPAFIQIANDGGVLPNPALILNTPVGYQQNKKNIVILDVAEHSLYLSPSERADVVVDFTHFAGKTVLLYNDAPAAAPNGDPRNDLYSEDGDQTALGGPGNTNPGMGPNTRTVMQFRVAATGGDSTAPPDDYDVNLLAALSDPAVGLPSIFGATQPAPLVPESAYNSVGYVGGSTTDNTVRIQDTSITFIPYGQSTPVTIPFKPKQITEEFSDQNGRMQDIIGTEIPFTNAGIQTTVLLQNVDPVTELFNDGETQIWQITHNGIDTHAMHFHGVNVQLINRVGWDGQVELPQDNEFGWKDTVKMNPLQDCIVAVRMASVPVPFGISNSWRYLSPSTPSGSTNFFSNLDPLTGARATVNMQNTLTNLYWEYLWQDAILEHAEDNMMRPISMIVPSFKPLAPVLGASWSADGLGITVALNWTDGTPYNYATGLPTTTLGNPTNEIGFRIERADATARVTTYTAVTNAPANTTAFSLFSSYTPSTNLYRVVAYNTAGDSVSAAVTLNIKVVPPSAPSGLTTKVTSLAPPTVSLSWVNTASNATAVLVQRSIGTGAFATLATLAPASATYADTAVLFNTNYTYRVYATNLGGSSAFSATATVAWPPSAPPSLTATSTNATLVKLTWTASTGQTGYRIERALGAGVFAPLATAAAATLTYADTNVLRNTAYSYRVFGTNAAGDSLASPTATVTTPDYMPTAPTNLTVRVSSLNPVTVSLAWLNTATNATSVIVQRSTGTGAFATVATLTATAAAYADTAVLFNTNYSYRVYALNPSGSSPLSASATVAWPPSAPPSLTATSTNASLVKLTWTASTGQTGYRIERALGAGAFTPLATVASATLTYADTNVVGLSAYSYRVFGTNAAGDSLASPTATVTTPDYIPAAPSGLTALVSSLSPVTVSLAWVNNATNATSVIVQRSTGTGAFVTVATLASTVATYADTTVSFNTNYSYRVFATNTAGSSAFSASATVAWPPSAPASLTATAATATLVNLTWTASTGQTGYRIERALGAGAFTPLATVASATLTYADATVLANTNYTYRVFGTNAVGSSLASPSATVATSVALVAPAAPSGLAALVSSLSPVTVSLTWVNNATNAVSVVVQRSTGTGAFATVATLASTVATYADTTVLFNTNYSYRVFATNAVGSSAFSATATVAWPPSAPASLTATSTNATLVNLTWTASTGQTGYRIERALGAGAFATLTNVASAILTYADASVAGGTAYSYRVFGTNTAGASLASPTATVTTPAATVIPTTVPAAPSGLTATLTGMNPATVVLTWVNNATNATSFQVQRATGTGAFAALATITGTNVTSYTNTTVVANTTYSYQVRAVNASTNSAFSTTAAVTVSIRHVQSVASVAVASASVVTTPVLAASQTAGNLNIVVVNWTGTNTAITSVVDSGAVTYTLAGTVTNVAANLRQSIYYASAVVGATRTATVTFNGAATSPGVYFLEYSGVKALDRSGGASGTAATATTGNPGNTTSANELVFSAASAATAVTAGTGFTSRLTTTTSIAQDKVLTRTGASTATAAVSGTTTTRKWVIQTVTFK